MKLTQAVEKQIDASGAIPEGAHVLAAISGGADSVAMLHVLHGLAPGHGRRITVAHLDHRIRGTAAREDMAFVRTLSETLGVPCVTGRSDVPGLARRKGISLEMAAREARYRFLARTARKVKADVVATAHTADDQAETVLLKLCRGAGPEGLAGMPPVSRVPGTRIPLVRPLLSVRRKQIESYLRRKGHTWHEDATNRDDAALRNRVRHEVLPLLETRLNPGVREALCRTAEIVREEDELLDALARDAWPGGTLRVEDLPGSPALRRRVLRLWLMDRGVPPELVTFDRVAQMARLAASRRGSRRLDIGEGWQVWRRYGEFALERAGAPGGFPRTTLAVPGETVISQIGCRITVTLEPGIVRPKRSKPGTLPAAASLSRRAVGRKKLIVRSWKPGDRMKPLGMKGSRKLQDILTDARVPVDRRGTIPVLECGGEIVWLPGYRVARGWEVGSEGEVAVRVGMRVG